MKLLGKLALAASMILAVNVGLADCNNAMFNYLTTATSLFKGSANTGTAASNQNGIICDTLPAGLTALQNACNVSPALKTMDASKFATKNQQNLALTPDCYNGLKAYSNQVSTLQGQIGTNNYTATQMIQTLISNRAAPDYLPACGCS